MDLKHRSRALTEGPERAAARAQLKGIGYDDEALSKPLIGVANTWIETMPCNFHLRALGAKVKEGIREAGGTPMEFNTVAISDGITMGTEGMKASLVSREVIADSIELVAFAQAFDAVIAISACDKTIPATVMALARLNVPSLFRPEFMQQVELLALLRQRGVLVLDVLDQFIDGCVLRVNRRALIRPRQEGGP